MNLRKITFSLIILFTTAFSSEINYSAKEKFPLHKEMEPAVDFWINAYAKYRTNQYVFMTRVI